MQRYRAKWLTDPSENGTTTDQVHRLIYQLQGGGQEVQVFAVVKWGPSAWAAKAHGTELDGWSETVEAAKAIAESALASELAS